MSSVWEGIIYWGWSDWWDIAIYPILDKRLCLGCESRISGKWSFQQVPYCGSCAEAKGQLSKILRRSFINVWYRVDGELRTWKLTSPARSPGIYGSCDRAPHVPSSCRSPKHPSQVLVHNKCDTIPREDTNKAGPKTTVETSETFLFPGTPDSGRDIGK